MGAAWEATSEGGGGADSIGNFYRGVVQAVLLFVVDTWVLTETTSKRLEGDYVSFLRQVTHKQEMRQRHGS